MHHLVRRVTVLATACLALAGLALLSPAGAAFGVAYAQSQALRIGAVVSSTGASAALGASEANTLAMLRDRFAKQSGPEVEITIFDDASQVANTIDLVTKLLSENQVDAIICCTRSDASLAVLEPVQSAGVPLISLAAAAPVTEPASARRWAFATVPTDRLILGGVVADMRANGVTDLVFLGLSDAFGESGLVELQLALPGSGIVLGDIVRYDAAAGSYTAPVLAATLSRPQAVLVWGIVDDSARMVRELRARGFGGAIYVSHGVGNDRFIELAGSAAEGVRLAVGPFLVASDLAANAPTRDVDLAYARDYEAAYPGESATSFGGYAFDAAMALVNAANYAQERGTLNPGNRAANRAALRDALEAMGPFVGVSGVFDYAGTDHQGLDERAYVIAEIDQGRWRLAH